jgi:alpha-1,3-fucosyltransferase
MQCVIKTKHFAEIIGEALGHDSKNILFFSRYIQWVVESAQYLYMDIHLLDNYFNWTMTYKKNSDFYLPYGRVVQIRPHPPPGSPELDQLIQDYGEKNRHLVHNRTENSAAWFVSHCATQARREKYAKIMQKYMTIDVYGKCAKQFHRASQRKTCSRANEWDCYKMLETNYKFYLSFENSVCSDYVTEKFFNIFKYDVIPVAFNGAPLDSFAPYHSSISVLDFESPRHLVKFMENVSQNESLYASYFWWRDYYELRNRAEDRAQAMCDLCAKLNSNPDPKIYTDMDKWWVTDSKCRKLKTSDV